MPYHASVRITANFGQDLSLLSCHGLDKTIVYLAPPNAFYALHI